VAGAASGGVERALTQAAEDADWDAVLDLLGRNWSQLVADPRVPFEVLDRVPRSILQANPRWITARSYLEHMMRGTGSVAYRNVTPDFGSSDALDELSHLTARLAENRARGSLSDAVADVEVAQARRHRVAAAERVALQHALPHLLIQWARVYELVERSGEAHVLLQEAFDTAELIGDAPSARNAAGRVAWIEAAMGRHGAATEWVERAERHTGHAPRHDSERMLAQTLRLADDLRTGDAQAVLDSQDLTQVHRESWAALQFVIAHVATVAAAPAALDGLLAAEGSRPSGLTRQGVNLVLLTHAKVRLLLLSGDTAGALRVTSDLPEHPGVLVARATALLAADQNRAVLAIAQRVRAHVGGNPRWRTKLDAVEGVALARIGADEAAGAVARRVVEAVPRLGLYSSLTLLAAPDIEQFLALAPCERAEPVRDRVLAHLSTRVVVRLSLLTRRERAVLRRVVSGDSLDEAAAALFVSKNTIKSQMASIYRKFGVTSREQVIALARSLPLDDDDLRAG
jgi:LuxR family maltose regulon positive regulatory protein